ncbi:MAG: site-specific DNA-methyltransferase, partial [Patescibacteria group bacterium]|nr:site-specific DNA-methyltransferase [Patescibacteria group bacterium]
SYLTYMRDRLFLANDLLHESGSIFVQISEENLHHVRELLDDVFGADNFVSQITIKRVTMFSKKLLNNATFYVIWYAKDKSKIKYHQLFFERDFQFMADSAGSHLRIESPDNKESRALTSEERNQITKFMKEHKGWRLYQLIALNANGTEKQDGFEFQGKMFYPPSGLQWKTSYEGLRKLKEKNRLEIEHNTLRYKTYMDDFPIITMNSLWDDIGPASDKIYVVQTPTEIIKRCMLMTTDPGDLVFDPTCGAGTTGFVAEQWGRRWITCDTSRVATALAKQRLMTAVFDYYELAHPNEGVKSGFKYKSVPHITLGSIANNETSQQEDLYDQPLVDNNKI